jgi:diguanylate cyclase (GGDEF)-like protein
MAEGSLIREWWRHRPWRARWTVVLGFGGMFALMLFLTFVGLRSLQESEARLDHITNNHHRKMILVAGMRHAARERIVNLQKMILLPDPFEIEDQYQQMTRQASRFIQMREEFQGLPLTEAEKLLLRKQGELTGISVPLQHRVLTLVRARRYREAQDLLATKAIPSQDRVFEVLQQLGDIQEESNAQALAVAKQDYNTARSWMVGLSVSTLLLGFLIAYAVVREYRRSDRALREEKERAMVTLHSLAEAVIRTDAGGHVEYMNPVAERLTGWPLTTARGQPLSHVFNIQHDITRVPADDPVAMAISRGTVVSDAGDIVLLTRSNQEHAVEYGATPVLDETGVASGVVVVFRDVTDVRALGRELVHQATHDPMTGMLNRREFENRAQQFLDSCRLADRVGSMLFMDLDLFKAVNDTCGHLAGDELLKQLSAILRRRVRREDVLARMGGDEFAVLLQDCPPDKAVEIATSLRRTVQNFRFVWEDRTLEIGASIGVVHVTANSGDLNDVFRSADVACRIAKEDGRNRVRVCQPDDENVQNREREINWIERVRRAIQQDSFVLYGQWIQPMGRHPESPTHCEVLLRYRDTDGLIVPPSAFLPAAERYHLMPAVDRSVVRSVFTALRTLPEDERTIFNINLSGQTLCDTDFLPFVLTELEQSGIPPSRLCFEITETAAVTHMSRAMELIGKLREAGCRFALDDFGSGLSSFTYLKNMPVDYLKIDGAFVRNIPDDVTDLAMVSSINQVAHIMGIRTIAEYVETDNIRATLVGIGVDYGQGYALARPAPLNELLQGLQLSPIQARNGTTGAGS